MHSGKCIPQWGKNLWAWHWNLNPSLASHYPCSSHTRVPRGWRTPQLLAPSLFSFFFLFFSSLFFFFFFLQLLFHLMCPLVFAWQVNSISMHLHTALLPNHSGIFLISYHWVITPFVMVSRYQKCVKNLKAITVS